AASMTLDMGNTDKLLEFRAEAERLGVKVESPSVNRSGVDFEVEGSTIHYALAALKGVGRQAVEAIVEARGQRPFADLSGFAALLDSGRGKAARAAAPARPRRLPAPGRKPGARVGGRRARAGGGTPRERRRGGRERGFFRRRGGAPAACARPCRALAAGRAAA